jgi:phosphoglycolate phosphatase
MPTSYIFDLDGTIAFTAVDIINSLKEAYSIARVPLKYFDFNSIKIGPPLDDLITLISPEVTRETRDLVKNEFSRLYDQSNYPETILTPGALDVLDYIKSMNAFCAIATSKRVVPARRIISKLSIAGFFNDIICTDSLLSSKLTKAEMLEHLVRHNGLNVERTWMIGDTDTDCVAAKKVGMRSIAVFNGYGTFSELELANPYILVPSLIEFLSILKGETHDQF